MCVYEGRRTHAGRLLVVGCCALRLVEKPGTDRVRGVWQKKTTAHGMAGLGLKLAAKRREPDGHGVDWSRWTGRARGTPRDGGDGRLAMQRSQSGKSISYVCIHER